MSIGCSDGDENNETGDGDGDGASTGDGDGDLNPGEPTGDGDLDPTNIPDGGAVDLTPEEIEAIEEAACTGWSAEGEGVPSVLQLVVDLSSSMNETAPGSMRSKWEETRDALMAAVDELPRLVSLGVLYYPNQVANVGPMASDPSSCVNTEARIPIEQLGDADSPHRMAVQQSLQDAELNQWTPTHDAYKHALDEGLLKYSSANRFMLLITDGAPTVAQGCIQQLNMPDEAAIIADIAAAQTDHGIGTFLIGSPGSEDEREWLSQAAIDGGTAIDGCETTGPNYCHLDMTEEPDFGAALAAGLANIAGTIIDSCTFEVPDEGMGQTVDPELTNVIITWDGGSSTAFLRDTGGDCTEGWVFNDDGNIELCEDSCNRVKADPKATVQLHFGCGVDIIPVK